MKVLNKLIITAVVCAAVVGFGTCSPWEGYVINLGSSGDGDKKPFTEEELEFLNTNSYLDNLEYTITITDGKEILHPEVVDDTFEIPVGVWDIKVEANGSRIKGYWESNDVRVPAGATVTFNLKDMTLVSTRVNSWDEIITDLGNLDKLGVDSIEIIGNLTSASSFVLDNGTQDIKLMAEEDVTITKSGANDNTLFNINKGTLTLDGTKGGKITIIGNADTKNSRAIINVQGGTLIMEDGVILKGNSTQHGGGVYIDSKGTFFMKGGIISGNTAEYGGGVFVDNTGTFTKTGGIIYGKDAGDDSNNATKNGHAICAGTDSKGAPVSGITPIYEPNTFDRGKIFNWPARP